MKARNALISPILLLVATSTFAGPSQLERLATLAADACTAQLPASDLDKLQKNATNLVLQSHAGQIQLLFSSGSPGPSSPRLTRHFQPLISCALTGTESFRVTYLAHALGPEILIAPDHEEIENPSPDFWIFSYGSGRATFEGSLQADTPAIEARPCLHGDCAFEMPRDCRSGCHEDADPDLPPQSLKGIRRRWDSTPDSDRTSESLDQDADGDHRSN